MGMASVCSKQGKAIDYEGASSLMDFDQFRHITGSYQIEQFDPSEHLSMWFSQSLRKFLRVFRPPTDPNEDTDWQLACFAKSDA